MRLIAIEVCSLVTRRACRGNKAVFVPVMKKYELRNEVWRFFPHRRKNAASRHVSPTERTILVMQLDGLLIENIEPSVPSEVTKTDRHIAEKPIMPAIGVGIDMIKSYEKSMPLKTVLSDFHGVLRR